MVLLSKLNDIIKNNLFMAACLMLLLYNTVVTMTHKWPGEPALDSEKALQLIQEQFPELHANGISLLGMGWDNKAYLINNTIIFRFPRREVAVKLLENELALLPQIAAQIPVPIPVPCFVGKATAEFPWPFTGYRMLIGTTADQADLSDDERTALAEPLAQFLSKLHAIDSNQLEVAVQIEDTFKKLDIPDLIEKTKSQLQEAEALALLQHDDVFYEIVKAASHLKLEDAKTIVHGDLYVRHLLLDEQHRLAGIIDWGDVMVGNPAIDLAIAHSFLPPIAHEAFRKAYGPITDAQWDFARLRALRHSLILICYGAKINDQVLLREGKKAVTYIAAGYKERLGKV